MSALHGVLHVRREGLVVGPAYCAVAGRRPQAELVGGGRNEDPGFIGNLRLEHSVLVHSHPPLSIDNASDLVFKSCCSSQNHIIQHLNNLNKGKYVSIWDLG